MVIVSNRIHRVRNDTRHKAHEDREEYPERDRRERRRCSVPAHYGEPDRQCKPERHIDDRECQEDQNSPYLFSGWLHARNDHSDCSDRDPHRVDDRGDHRGAGQKFPDNNGVPVDRLRYKPVQRASRALAVHRVKSERQTDDRPEQRDEGHKGRNRISARRVQTQKQIIAVLDVAEP